MQFYPYPFKKMPDLSGCIVLTPDAPQLTRDDAHHGLVLLDATWRLAGKMLKAIQQVDGLIYRSLPPMQTAYPRRQDEEQGLASVEALFAAYHILGRDTQGIIDHYHWKEMFFKKNSLGTSAPSTCTTSEAI